VQEIVTVIDKCREMREGREGGCKHDKNECVIFFNKGRRKNEI